jgi:hypothetical protein
VPDACQRAAPLKQRRGIVVEQECVHSFTGQIAQLAVCHHDLRQRRPIARSRLRVARFDGRRRSNEERVVGLGDGVLDDALDLTRQQRRVTAILVLRVKRGRNS